MSSPATERSAGFGDVLVRLAGERPNMLVVSGEDIGTAEWFYEVWPERVLTVPALMSRLSIAQGVTLGGGDAVVMLDDQVVELPIGPATGIVMVTQTAAHLRLAFRAGLQVCQPGWIEDLPALLVGALGQDLTTVLHLPDRWGVVGDPPLPTTFGERRVLHRGTAGLVLGAGATAEPTRQVAATLAEGGVGVTAMDLHTITAASGVDASLLHDHLLVGPLDSPRASAMDSVQATGDVEALAAQVRKVLHRG